MLLVETYLAPSPIAGIGVFARHAVPKGTTLWKPHPGVDLAFTPHNWEAWLATMHPSSAADMRRHSYKQGGRIILCLDNGRFMNHADADANVGNDSATDTMFARHDIAAGTELLCDYGEYSDPDDIHLGLIHGRD